ncbi:hypothetical protein GCM10027262_08040 [Nocardia tengchongensis]
MVSDPSLHPTPKAVRVMARTSIRTPERVVRAPPRRGGRGVPEQHAVAFAELGEEDNTVTSNRLRRVPEKQLGSCAAAVSVPADRASGSPGRRFGAAGPGPFRVAEQA